MSSPQLPLGLALVESARFDNFVAGPNREPLEALQQAAQGGSEMPLFLAGPRATGKTHLLQAACRMAGESGLGCSFLPLQARSGLSPKLLDGLEQLALVCLDDVDTIAGDSVWEGAVFSLFNRLREAGSMLLVSAADPPARCGFLLPDLATRLAWGVAYRLQPLAEADVLRALALRARQRGLELPDDTARFLMRRMPRDLASAFGFLDHLDKAAMVEQRRLTIPFVKSVLAGSGRPL